MKNLFYPSAGKASSKGVFPALLVGLMIITSQVIGCAAPTPKPMNQTMTSNESCAEARDLVLLEDQSVQIQEKWGVEVLSIRLSANGYMLDFRYRVTDAEKAALLFDGRIKPYLLDQATGERLFVPTMPKVGSLRSIHPPITDRTYYMLFRNINLHVKSGSKVSVVVGDFKAENLVVE